MRLDEFPHQLDALRIIDNENLHAPLPKQVFCAHEVAIFTDDDPRDPVEQCRASTHEARAECADHGQVGPIAPASGIAEADHFCVCGRVSGLHAQVVAAGHDLPVLIG